MIKAKAGGMLIDIVSPKELINSSSDDINRIGIIVNDVVYPLRSKTDSRPGVYPVNRYLSFLRNPEENEIDNYKATDENIIDFNNSKSIQDIINAKNKYLQMESTILTSADNITTPIDHPDDSPEMLALKEAIRCKHIDINKYEQRFGPNFNNDRRLLDKNTITLAKLKTMANALDMDISLTIKDKPGNIPNPIGKVITVSVTDEFSDELEEKGDQQ